MYRLNAYLLVFLLCSCTSHIGKTLIEKHYTDQFSVPDKNYKEIMEYKKGGFFSIGRHKGRIIPKYLFLDSATHVIEDDPKGFQTIAFVDTNIKIKVYINSNFRKLAFGKNLLDTTKENPIEILKGEEIIAVAKREEISLILQYFPIKITAGDTIPERCRSRADLSGVIHYMKGKKTRRSSVPFCGSVYGLPVVIPRTI